MSAPRIPDNLDVPFDLDRSVIAFVARAVGRASRELGAGEIVPFALWARLRALVAVICFASGELGAGAFVQSRAATSAARRALEAGRLDVFELRMLDAHAALFTETARAVGVAL
jgi:hypothetical protein